MLVPNNKQKTKLFECAGVARFAYNWVIHYEKICYEIGNDFMSDIELRKVLTQLKQTEKYKWLNNYSNNITKQAIKDAVKSYIDFFKGKSRYPRYKKKRKCKLSFYVDTSKLQITETHVKLEKLTISKKANKQQFNKVRLAERNRIPLGVKYYNPRVSYDGINWWLTVGVEIEDKIEKETSYNEGIGIDLGIKELAVCSDKVVYKNINKTKKIRHLRRKERKIQRKISRKYLMNKKGGRYCKTKNIIKSEKKLLGIRHKISNTRYNYLHQVTTEIINRKPKFIVLEDLNVKGMLKNKNLAKSIQEECFNKFYNLIGYKANRKGIEIIVADRWYPSSKKCIQCGNIKKDLKLSDRVYKCDRCGNEIDRDYQAALNLARYKI